MTAAAESLSAALVLELASRCLGESPWYRPMPPQTDAPPMSGQRMMTIVRPPSDRS